MTLTLFAKRASLVAAALGTAGALVAIAGPKKQQREPYDPDVALAKMQRVANSLRLYREEYGYKDPSEWQTPADAGLPPNPLVLQREGHDWTLPNGARDLQPAFTGSDNVCLFMCLPPVPEANAPCHVREYQGMMREWARGAAQLGTKLPFLVDQEIGRNSTGEIRPIRLLYWDGSTEIVTMPIRFSHQELYTFLAGR